MIWCVEHDMEILGGGDAAMRQRIGNQDDDTMEEKETGPVAFVSEATMNDTTQQLVKTLVKRDR